MSNRMTALYYAIGDVHGCDNLLGELHKRIVEDHQSRHVSAKGIIVHLGDYVDRGANSLGVIDRLMNGLPGFETICLKGNHEELMLNCLEIGNRQAWWTWLGNGGKETLKSFGISLRSGRYNPEQLTQALGTNRIAWLQSLPLYHRVGDYLFVHAGIVPGRKIEDQEEKDLLWIRAPFLKSEANHGFCVVHGHTPTNQPYVRHNRIGIDTGAPYSGQLTAVVLGEAEGPRFMSVNDEPG